MRWSTTKLIAVSFFLSLAASADIQIIEREKAPSHDLLRHEELRAYGVPRNPVAALGEKILASICGDRTGLRLTDQEVNDALSTYVKYRYISTSMLLSADYRQQYFLGWLASYFHDASDVREKLIAKYCPGKGVWPKSGFKLGRRQATFEDLHKITLQLASYENENPPGDLVIKWKNAFRDVIIRGLNDGGRKAIEDLERVANFEMDDLHGLAMFYLFDEDGDGISWGDTGAVEKRAARYLLADGTPSFSPIRDLPPAIARQVVSKLPYDRHKDRTIAAKLEFETKYSPESAIEDPLEILCADYINSHQKPVIEERLRKLVGGAPFNGEYLRLLAALNLAVSDDHRAKMDGLDELFSLLPDHVIDSERLPTVLKYNDYYKAAYKRRLELFRKQHHVDQLLNRVKSWGTGFVTLPETLYRDLSLADPSEMKGYSRQTMPRQRLIEMLETPYYRRRISPGALKAFIDHENSDNWLSPGRIH